MPVLPLVDGADDVDNWYDVLSFYDRSTWFDFLRYFPADEASAMHTDCSWALGDLALEGRNAAIPAPVFPLPDAAGVTSFLARLGIEPVGRVVVVDQDPAGLSLGYDAIGELWGLADPFTRTCYVNRAAIHREVNDPQASDWATLLVRSAAVHELVHLAGYPDWVFYGMEKDLSGPLPYAPACASALEVCRGIRSREGWRGQYLEEGLASLVQSLFVWASCPKVAESDGVEVRSSGDATVLVPERHVYRESAQPILAYGVERLVEAFPALWEALLASRRYGAEWWSTRAAVQACLAPAGAEFFDELDSVQLDDLHGNIAVTAKIVAIADSRRGPV